jgi:gliding motility-associated-like protein
MKYLFALLLVIILAVTNCGAQSDPCASVVAQNAYAEPVLRNATNELDRVTEGKYSKESLITGPAPLVIDFYSETTAPFVEWVVYDAETPTGNSQTFRNDNDLKQTFLNVGKHYVKLIVSNGSTCSDSTYFIVQVTESRLDCPNYFSPRSTPGENDEFKVVYRSLISFKGRIINRWGNVLFEWSDPAQGWNGTYKGKAVSPGVYFYLIDAKGSDGVVYKKKGDINLLE